MIDFFHITWGVLFLFFIFILYFYEKNIEMNEKNEKNENKKKIDLMTILFVIAMYILLFIYTLKIESCQLRNISPIPRNMIEAPTFKFS